MIIIDGKNISEFGFDVESGHDDPLTPTFEHKLLHIPGRAGAWNFGSEIKERLFSFNLKIHERFHDRMQQAFNELVAFLFDEYGQPRLVKIVREYEPDKFIMAKVAVQLTPDRMTDEGALVLPFIAEDPYKYSRALADEVVWGSREITFQWNYLMGHKGAGDSTGVKITANKTIQVDVAGLAIQPVFEIEGTASNLRIECGKYSFQLPNFSNLNWIIDFEKYVVYRDGTETMIDMNKFYLLPGTNAIRVTGSGLSIDMRIKYRDRFN